MLCKEKLNQWWSTIPRISTLCMMNINKHVIIAKTEINKRCTNFCVVMVITIRYHTTFVVGFGRRSRDRTVKIIAFTYNQTYELDSRFLSRFTRYSIKQEVRKLVSNLQQVGGLLSSTCIPACFLHGNKPDHHNPSTEHCLSPISAF